MSLVDLLAMRKAAKLAALELSPEELKEHLDKEHARVNCPIRNNFNAIHGSLGLNYGKHDRCVLGELLMTNPQKFYFYVGSEYIHITAGLEKVTQLKDKILELVPEAEFVVAIDEENTANMNCSDVCFIVTTDGFKITKARGFQDKVGCYIAF